MASPALRALSLGLLVACACAVDNAGLGSGAGGAGQTGAGGIETGAAGASAPGGNGGGGGVTGMAGAGALGGDAEGGGGAGGGVAGTTGGVGATAGTAGGGGQVPLGGESGQAAPGGAGGDGGGGETGGARAGGGAAGVAGTGLAGAGGTAAGGESGRGGSAAGGEGGRGGAGAGGFCGGCPPCMRCANGACALDPGSLWKVRCVSATVAQTKPTGDAWDLGIGGATAPDPLCAFWLGNASAAETSALSNTFTPAWNESITPGTRFMASLLTSQASPWSVRVTDEDAPAGAETICSVSPVLDAAAFVSGSASFSAGSCTTLEIGLERVALAPRFHVSSQSG